MFRGLRRENAVVVRHISAALGRQNKMQLKLVLFLIVFCSLLNAQIPDNSIIKDKGKFENDKSYEMVIQNVPCPKNQRDTLVWWGMDGGKPYRIIGKINLKIGNQKIELPYQVYFDLAEVTKASISYDKKNNEYILTISGGDGAGRYEAQLRFKDVKIVKRKVKLMEFPEDAWDESTFHNTIPDSLN